MRQNKVNAFVHSLPFPIDLYILVFTDLQPQINSFEEVNMSPRTTRTRCENITVMSHFIMDIKATTWYITLRKNVRIRSFLARIFPHL